MPPVQSDPQHHRSIFDGSLDAILLIDPRDGRVLDANRAALTIYDQGLVGRSLLEDSADRETTRERLERVMREGALRFDVLQRLRDGRELHMEVNATATTVEGQPAILSIMRDVTERVIAAQALSASEERMRTVLENVSASVWTLSERSELVFLAGRLQALGGRRAEDLTIEQAMELWAAAVDPDDMDRIVGLQRAVFESGEGYDIEYPFRRTDGSRGWLNDRASSVYERDGVRYVDGATFDITERKEIEIQQREAAEFGRRAVRVQELHSLFADACSTVLYVMSSSSVAFYRHDPAAHRFVLVSLAGEHLEGAEVIADGVENVGGFTFAGTRPVAFDDLETETRFGSPVLAANGIRSGIVAPVRGRTVSVGGMCAVSRMPRRFTAREIAFVQTIANAVAEAVERIQAETELRRNQAQLADAQALAHIGSFEVDLGSGLVHWSDELYRIVGLEPQSRSLTLDTVGNEFVDRKVAQEIVEGILILPEGGTVEREHLMRAVDGTMRYVRTRGTKVPAANGEQPKVFGIVQDITMQRRAENALREREARLELIVSRLPVIIWSTDEKLKLTSIAGAGFAAIAEDWVRELDLELDQLLGVPRDTEARAADALAGTPVQYEVSDGARELRVHVEPLRDAHGTIVGTVGIAFDRTSQNRTERVLSQIAQGVVSDVGERFFPGAVASLARTLHADVVFIAERTGTNGELLRTIAVNSNGEPGDELLYQMCDTPCERVLRDGFFWMERGVRRAFPEDALLETLKIESYAGVAILDSAGKPIGLVTMMNRRPFPRDAAAEAALRIYADRASAELDRTRRERSLRDAKNYVENLIDSANVLIIENDLEGRVRLVNRAFEALTGRSRAEVVDSLVFELFVDGLDAWRRDADARRLALNGGRPIALGEQETESAIHAADGTTRILSLRSNDVFRDGQVVGTIFFGVDVTDSVAAAAEQERLQQQVFSAAAEWRNTFDSVVTPIVIVDAAGQLTRVNHAATELTKRGFQHLVGSAIGSLAETEPWTTAAAVVRRILDSRLRAAVEEARDTSGRTWNISAVPLGGTGQPSVILVLSDISGIVDLQESLRVSERMSAMGQLVAGVAHEVRNPLFGISAALDAFEAEFGRTPDVAEYVERLRSDADRLRRLMNDLLEFGRPAALRVERQPFGPVIERSIRVCDAETRAKNVTVTLTAAADLRDIPIDHDRMLQVLKNVIENATSFTATGSEVTIDVRTDGGFLVCSIADQGPGFRAEDIPHVFEPFFTRRRGGTGLGLAIVQRIVGDHGGTVSVRNREQGGAIVELRLPG
jgi:PAS domain S-box-containing protein